MAANERKIESIEGLVERKIEEGIRRIGLPAGGSAPDGSSPMEDYPCLPGSSILGQEMSTSSGSYATALTNGASFSRQSTVDRREREYWIARRSLRLRPVVTDGESCREGAIRFMRDTMKLDGSTIDGLGEFVAEKVPFGPKTKHKNEVIVRFTTVEARDVVRSAATNLAGCGPEVGVRLEVPNHLRASMKAVQTLSYDLKQKHPGARRNVLYDDELMDLVLDFSIGDGHPWRRVTADQARRRSSKAPGRVGGGFRIGEGELDDLLGGAQE